MQVVQLLSRATCRLVSTGVPSLATRAELSQNRAVVAQRCPTHKGRTLLTPVALLPIDSQPCFASNKAQQDYYDQIWFSRIRSLSCLP